MNNKRYRYRNRHRRVTFGYKLRRFFRRLGWEIRAKWDEFHVHPIRIDDQHDLPPIYQIDIPLG